MANKIQARVKFITPLGTYYGKSDEIDDTKNSFQDYVQEATSPIVDAGDGGITSFTDYEDRTIFIMPEVLKNSVILVERIE